MGAVKNHFHDEICGRGEDLEERFWSIVDRDGLTGLPSDMWEALDELVWRAARAETHEVFYVQFADDGTSIRKWSRPPFEGARMCCVSLPKAACGRSEHGAMATAARQGEDAAGG